MNILETALSFKDKNRNELNLHQSLDWCAETVKEIINQSAIPEGAKGVGTISCNETISRMRNNPYWYEPMDDMKPGDVIFYNWQHDYDRTGNIDHVGVIIEVTRMYIKVIEGNTEGRENTACVRLVTRLRDCLNFNCEYPDYYMRLKPYEIPHTNNTTSKNLEKLQELVRQLRKISDEIERVSNNSWRFNNNMI